MGPFRPGQIVTVFRSRVQPGAEDAYHETAEHIADLARGMSGLVEFKTFTADDGERVTVATFDDDASQAAWRHQADHVAAQRRGRTEFYAEYSVQVARTERVSHHRR